VGLLWLSGPIVTAVAGYLNKPDLTEEMFHAKLLGSKTPFLRTGDMAFYEDDYNEYVCGRQKDLLIVNRVNYYPQDIEVCVQDTSPAVRPGCVVVFCADDHEANGNLEVVFEIRTSCDHQALMVSTLCIQ